MGRGVMSVLVQVVALVCSGPLDARVLPALARRVAVQERGDSDDARSLAGMLEVGICREGTAGICQLLIPAFQIPVSAGKGHGDGLQQRRPTWEMRCRLSCTRSAAQTARGSLRLRRASANSPEYATPPRRLSALEAGGTSQAAGLTRAGRGRPLG